MCGDVKRDIKLRIVEKWRVKIIIFNMLLLFLGLLIFSRYIKD